MAESAETAGPSAPRVATVMSEEEEAALETGIVASSADDAVNTAAEEALIVPKVEESEEMSGEGAAGPSVNGESEVKMEGQSEETDQKDGQGAGTEEAAEPASALAPGPDPNAMPDNACETLYIQNLNEKVQVDGMFAPSLDMDSRRA